MHSSKHNTGIEQTEGWTDRMVKHFRTTPRPIGAICLQ